MSGGISVVGSSVSVVTKSSSLVNISFDDSSFVAVGDASLIVAKIISING